MVKRYLDKWKKFLPKEELNMIRFMEHCLRKRNYTDGVRCFVGLSNSRDFNGFKFGSLKVISRQSITLNCKLKKVLMDGQALLDLHVVAEFDHVIDPHLFTIKVNACVITFKQRGTH
jgi:hypothetical protein